MSDRTVKWILILVVCVLFGPTILSRLNQIGTTPAPQVSAFVNQFQSLPDHLSTQQMIDWAARCKNGGVTVADCQRLASMVTAKLQACKSRMGIRDFIALKTQKDDSPEHQLFYCDQRFPDLR